jgi:excisionase family DNA binding protein
MTEKRLINVVEAAEFLGISRYTLYEWTSARKVPFHKVGSLVKFDPQELLSWTKERAYKPQKRLDLIP